MVFGICRVKRQEIENFMNPHPKGSNFGVKIVKLMYFFKNVLQTGTWFRQTKCIVMITKKGSTKIVNFMTPGAGVRVVGRGHISHVVKLHISLKIVLSTPRHSLDKLII